MGVWVKVSHTLPSNKKLQDTHANRYMYIHTLLSSGSGITIPLPLGCWKSVLVSVLVSVSCVVVSFSLVANVFMLSNMTAVPSFSHWKMRRVGSKITKKKVK